MEHGLLDGRPAEVAGHYSCSYSVVVYHFYNVFTTGRFTGSAGWIPTLHLPLEVLKRCTEVH